MRDDTFTQRTSIVACPVLLKNVVAGHDQAFIAWASGTPIPMYVCLTLFMCFKQSSRALGRPEEANSMSVTETDSVGNDAAPFKDTRTWSVYSAPDGTQILKERETDTIVPVG